MNKIFFSDDEARIRAYLDTLENNLIPYRRTCQVTNGTPFTTITCLTKDPRQQPLDTRRSF
jgi:hypothetical protein